MYSICLLYTICHNAILVSGHTHMHNSKMKGGMGAMLHSKTRSNTFINMNSLRLDKASKTIRNISGHCSRPSLNVHIKSVDNKKHLLTLLRSPEMALPFEWIQMEKGLHLEQHLWQPLTPLGLSAAAGKQWPAAGSHSGPEESHWLPESGRSLAIGHLCNWQKSLHLVLLISFRADMLFRMDVKMNLITYFKTFI